MRRTLFVLVALTVLGAVLLPGPRPAPVSGVGADVVSSSVGPAGEPLRGDVDKNGEVNSIDAFLILQYDAAIIDPLPNPKTWYQNGDVNEDDLLDSLDATLILQFHAGLIHSL